MRFLSLGAGVQSTALAFMIKEGVRGTKDKLFLHRSCVPLAEIDFKAMVAEQEAKEKEAKRQGTFAWWQDMQEECEGICGL